MNSSSYFSVLFTLIKVDSELPYDLYVNSSSVDDKPKYIRIFPRGETLSQEDLYKFKKKYYQVYIPESQRELFLNSLANKEHLETIEKTSVLKDMASKHLENIFEGNHELESELLEESLEACKETVQEMVNIVTEVTVDELRGLMGDLSFHDFYTYDHSINVSLYSVTILKELFPKSTEEELTQIGLGGLLHDIGKIKVPVEVLNSVQKLSEEDFAHIKRHPIEGVNLMRTRGIREIDGLDAGPVISVIEEHHEHYDGSGYPKGLKGGDIHLFSKIVAIADFFDAVTTKRPYQDILETDQAIEIMRNTRGKKLDPVLFDKFASIFGTLKNSLAKETKLIMDETFDSERPCRKLPIKQVKSEQEKEEFGKVKVGKD